MVTLDKMCVSPRSSVVATNHSCDTSQMPTFAVLIFNVVIFVLVIGVIIRHTRNKLDHIKEQMNIKTATKLVSSILYTGIMLKWVTVVLVF